LRKSIAVISTMLSSVRVSTGISEITRAVIGEAWKAGQHARIGREQARHAARGADVKRARGAVADRVGQICFQPAVARKQRRMRVGLRLEARHRAKLKVEHRFVRRRAVGGERIGAHIHHGRQPLRTQQLTKWVGGAQWDACPRCWGESVVAAHSMPNRCIGAQGRRGRWTYLAQQADGGRMASANSRPK
jgi:hypothetical protein